MFVKFVGKLNPTLPSSAGQANALCVIIGGRGRTSRAPLFFLELQMMIILHFRRFVGSDQQPARQPFLPSSLLVMAEPAWNDDAYNPIIVCGPTVPAALRRLAPSNAVCAGIHIHRTHRPMPVRPNQPSEHGAHSGIMLEG